MATQKVDQEPGAYERQVSRRRRADRNRRLAAIVTVLVFVAIAAAAAFAHFRSDKSVPTTPPSHIPIPNANGALLDLRTGKTSPLPADIATSGDYYAVSPDHKMVAFNACCSTYSPLFTSNIDGTQVTQVSSSGEAAFASQWSPDGSMLVYQQRPDTYTRELLGNLFVWNVATGQRTRVTNLDQTHQWGYWAMLPSFSADGKSILFQLPRGHLPPDNNSSEDLWSVPVTGGKPTLVRRNAGSGSYSPDGRWLAYVSQQSQLMITSAQGGTPRPIVQGNAPPSTGAGWLRWSPDATRISYSTDDGSIYVLDVATGAATKVAEGGHAEWLDNNTLIVANPAT